MLTRTRKTRGRRTGRTGAALWVAGLLVALTAPAVLEAQERNRGRDRDRARVLRFGGPMMARGMLGLTLGTRPADTDAQGAEVRGVADGGPAGEAGLQEGDIITALGGQSLLEPLADTGLEERVDPDRSVPSQRLLLLARELEPGEEVVVEYLRDGAPRSATVEPRAARTRWGFDADRMEEVMEEARARALEATERAREVTEQMREQWDDHAWFPEAGSPVAVMGLRASHGIRLVTLNPELGRYFNAASGALVTEVDEGSPLGLQAGDVVLAIDGRAIDSAGDVRRILRSYEEGEAVTLTIMRDRAETQVGGTVEDQVRPRRGGIVGGPPVGLAGRRFLVARRAPGRGFFWRASNRARQPWRAVRR